MTDNMALEALNRYLNGDINLDTLEERVIPLAWDTALEDQDLIDLVSIEIAYIKDGVSDETILRERLAKVAASKQGAVIV